MPTHGMNTIKSFISGVRTGLNRVAIPTSTAICGIGLVGSYDRGYCMYSIIYASILLLNLIIALFTGMHGKQPPKGD